MVVSLIHIYSNGTFLDIYLYLLQQHIQKIGFNAKIYKKIVKISKYLEIKDKSFNGFLDWLIDFRKKLNLPNKLSDVIDEKDLDLDRLSEMALNDPSTSGNPKKLTKNDMKILYQHSISGELFR